TGSVLSAPPSVATTVPPTSTIAATAAVRLASRRLRRAWALSSASRARRLARASCFCSFRPLIRYAACADNLVRLAVLTPAEIHGQQGMVGHEVGDLGAQRLSRFFVVAEVLSGEDAARGRLVRGPREARERPGDADGRVGERERVHVGAEEVL